MNPKVHYRNIQKKLLVNGVKSIYEDAFSAAPSYTKVVCEQDNTMVACVGIFFFLAFYLFVLSRKGRDTARRKLDGY